MSFEREMEEPSVSRKMVLSQSSIWKIVYSNSQRVSSNWLMHCRHHERGITSLVNCSDAALHRLQIMVKFKLRNRARISSTSSVFVSKS